MKTIQKRKLFLNRQNEIGLIKTLIRELLAGRPIQRPIQYFYGVPMVGKTSLLLEIMNITRSVFGIPTAYIDFDTKQSEFANVKQSRYHGELAILNLVNDIVQQFKAGSDQFSEFVERNVIIKDFVEYFADQKVKSQKPFVFLFDTLEDVDIETFEHLQNDILNPLLDNRNILVIFAARAKVSELSITFGWSIRRQLKTHQLAPFNFDDTTEHFKKLSMEAIEPVSKPKKLYDITNGIPGLNEFVVLNNGKGDQELLKRVVERAIFYRAPKTHQVLDLLTTISVCRLFDTELLAHLVENLDLQITEKKDQHLGTNLLMKLLETTLVEHRQDGMGYAVADDIRKLIDNYLREFNPIRHIKTHWLAYKWFEKEVGKGDIVLLADLLYHQAGIFYDKKHAKLDSLSNLEIDHEVIDDVDVLNRLKKILNQHLATIEKYPRATILVKRIKEKLSGNEFTWFLNRRELDSLIELCDTYQ